jgi:hypothetical protein
MSNEEIKYDEKYYFSLDRIREMGVCNMWGASGPLRQVYPELSKNEASAILVDWIQTFDQRHPEGCDCGGC